MEIPEETPAPTPEAHDDLEDTKPRRIAAAPAAQPPAEPDAADAATAAVVLAAAQDSIEATLPVKTAAPPAAPLSGLEATAPVPAARPAAPPPTPAPQQTRPAPTPRPPAQAASHPPARRPPARKNTITWLLIPLVGALALVLIAMLSAFSGYASGINLRRSAESTQVAGAADEQYQLALEDIAQGQYFRARQRLEYVIKANPNYPGAADKLAEVLLELNTTATPTLVPTPTVTPTPDTRNIQDLYNQADQAMLNSLWTEAIDALLALRKIDPAYEAVKVDGQLFVALRNRGRDKILKESDLEGGIYDLTLASKFGPLDSEAQGLLNWTTLYITGASFWGIDWEQAVSYFQQVAPQTPNLMDGSKMTATERLRQALFELGNQQAASNQYCKALQNYQQSLAIAPDPAVQQAAELAQKGCEGGGGSSGATETPKPGKKPKKTPTP